LRLMPRRRHSPGPDRSRGWSVRGIQRRRLRPRPRPGPSRPCRRGRRA
jgi:hypothetical protein